MGSEEAIVEFEAASFVSEMDRAASMEKTQSYLKLEAAVNLAAHGPPSEPVVLSGPLMKQATSWHGTFQQRYFEIGGGRLRYWPSITEKNKGDEPNAQLTLAGVKTWQCWEPESQFEVTLKANMGRPPFVLQARVTGADAGQAHTVKDWIETIKAHEAYAVKKIVYEQAVRLADS